MSKNRGLFWIFVFVGFLIFLMVFLEGLNLGPSPEDPIVRGNPWLPFMDLSYVLLSQSFIWGAMIISIGITVGLVYKFMNLSK